jgi:tRNA1(Val) A37 N6-methylase TrmN6
LRLYQPESGYCFNSDSLFLYDFINKLQPKGTLLDVGAGCGIVGLLVARDNPKVTVEAVEKQPVFVEFAKKNAAENKLAYTIYTSDFLAFDAEKKYDYIVSNPPFYHSGAKKTENKMLATARYNEHLPIEDFFKKVSRLLKPHAHFVFCYDATQLFDVSVALSRVKMRLCDVRFVHPKEDRNASLMLLHARNGSKSMVRVWPPLIHFKQERLTQEVADIYSKAKTESIKCQL